MLAPHRTKLSLPRGMLPVYAKMLERHDKKGTKPSEELMQLHDI